MDAASEEESGTSIVASERLAGRKEETMKPKCAFFSFTSCEGCQLAILEEEPELLDILGAIEIVNFREASSRRIDDHYDVAFIEGAISRESEIPELKAIRDRSAVVVAIGACSVLGGINSLKNVHDLKEAGEYVYGEHAKWMETITARPVHSIVAVDHVLRGCPIDKREILVFLKNILRGMAPPSREHAVCFECKLRETACLWDRGSACLGPVIRGGCGAICPAFGSPCDGCRGVLSEPNFDGLYHLVKERGYPVEIVRAKLRLYNGYQEAEGALPLV